MKKIFLITAVATLLTACSSEELQNTDAVLQNGAEIPVAFSIYTQRSVTRAGLPGEQTTATIATNDDNHGFGVFGYYTNGETYSSANTFPNFMYNQQVKGDGATTPTWTYEPVKYWPNEYGDAATADDVDRVSFFAYAPWTKVTPSTGLPLADQTKNITLMTKNNAIGDPYVKYVVDPDPATSVDLLWGVAAVDYSTTWGTGAAATVTAGEPFIDLTKPSDPLAATATGDNKVRFNLRHALSKLNVTIDYIDDAATPAGPAVGNIESAPVTTKIFIREIKIGGFTMKGALNLNNKGLGNYAAGTPAAGTPMPNWKAYDGVSDIANEDEDVRFKDGRKDGREGVTGNEAGNEKYLGLNPVLIQSVPYSTTLHTDGTTTVFNDANVGVTNTKVNLFNSATATDPIYVIPRDQNIDVEIIYDVETVNPKLSDFLSDGVTHGLSIENKIRKSSADIFGSAKKMQAGIAYTLNIHLGMTSVKVSASVQGWDDTTSAGNAILPENQ